MNRSRARYLAAVGLLALAAFAVRAVSLDVQSLWRDEVDALCYAFQFPYLIAQTLAPETARDLSTPCACAPPPLTPGEPSGDRVLLRLARTLGGMIQQNGPLYFFLLRGWVTVTGMSEYVMRFFSLVFGVLCVPLVYALGRRLFNQQTGLLAALLVTTSPYLTWYGQEVKMYTLVPALVLLALYAQKIGLRRAVEEKGWRRLLWGAVQVVATSLALYSHVLVALLIPVQVLLYLAWWPQTRKRWVGVLVILACLILPYLPLAIWQAQRVLEARQTGFYPYALDEMVEILLNCWGLGILTRAWPWGTVLMGALAVWGLASPLFLSSPSHGGGLGGGGDHLALVSWLVTPLLAVWLISLRQPLFTDRYLIWTAPAFYLLVASGLASLRRFGGWGRWAAALLAGVVLVSNGSNLRQQATVPIKSDFRAATAYLANYHTSGERDASQAAEKEYTFRYYLPLVVADHRTFGELIIFQIPYGRYTFDYYFPREGYPWADGLYTNHRALDGSYMMSEQEAAYRLREMTAGYTAVWLVATETTMWDERGLVQAWLENNAQRVDEAHFMRVDVYRYVK